MIASTQTQPDDLATTQALPTVNAAPQAKHDALATPQAMPSAHASPQAQPDALPTPQPTGTWNLASSRTPKFTLLLKP